MILVAFDIDGTLTPITSSWAYVHRILNTLLRSKHYMKLFFNSLISYEEWVALDLNLWRGVSFKVFENILYTIPWRHGIEALKELKNRYRDRVFFLAITGGFDILGKRAVEELDFDDYIGVEVEVDSKGKLTGFAKSYIDFHGKGEALIDYIASRDLRPSYIISVGDSINDLDMFRYSDISIAFCNTKELRSYVDIAISSCDIRKLASALRAIIEELSDESYGTLKRDETSSH